MSVFDNSRQEAAVLLLGTSPSSEMEMFLECSYEAAAAKNAPRVMSRAISEHNILDLESNGSILGNSLSKSCTQLAKLSQNNSSMPNRSKDTRMNSTELCPEMDEVFETIANHNDLKTEEVINSPMDRTDSNGTDKFDRYRSSVTDCDLVTESSEMANDHESQIEDHNVNGKDKNIEDVAVDISDALTDSKEERTENKNTEKAGVKQDEKRLSVTSNLSIDIHCRICHCGGEDEKLISPCSCAGSLQFIHESCLVQWMKSKMVDNCELCQGKIEIVRKVKPVWRWHRPTQRPYALIWVMTFIAALILNVASVVKDASNHCISTPCIVFYSVGCFGAILAAVFMIYFARRAKDFIRHWIRINEDWVILDKDSAVFTKRTGLCEPRPQRVIFATEGLTTMV